ncbi:MAG: type II secretion system GspH family protein [Candidatus Pacebacteria bacterium]|nr:type II secretion system GspH family protein [Candidatus Paceibacterota bacterium]
MYRKKGFTLLELLVVIAVVGILATIIIPTLRDAQTRAQNASIVATMANINALVDAEKYPNSLENLCFEFEPGGPLADVRTSVEEKGGIWHCDSTVDSYRIFAKLNLEVVSAMRDEIESSFAKLTKSVAAQTDSQEHDFGNYYCVNSEFNNNFTHWSGENLLYPSCNDVDYTGVIQDPVENPDPTPDPNPESDPEPPIEDGGPACDGGKTEICHFGKTLCVGNTKGHLKHGDTEGPC